MKIALFGIHKLLTDSLIVLEKAGLFPEVVIFPPIESPFHNLAVEICTRRQMRFIRPESVKNTVFIEELRSYSPDRIIVVGYHQIFPKSLLELAPMGVINFHGGLLPEEKGPIPWKWAVYENRAFTGYTVHQMTDKVDEGKVFIKEKIELDKDESSESLFNKVAEAMANALPVFFEEKEMEDYLNNDADEAAGYRGQVSPELCRFDLEQTGKELQRRVRAFSPRPGVYLENNGQRILVKKMEILPEAKPEGAWIFKSADQYVKLTDYEIIKQ